jgi:hypothetical protein
VRAHFTTLQEACERLLGFGPAEDLLRATVTRRLGDRPHVELAAGDSTGLEARQVSPYFVKRRAKGQDRSESSNQTTTYARFPEVELGVDYAAHPRSAVRGHDLGALPRRQPPARPAPVRAGARHDRDAAGRRGHDWERARHRPRHLERA